MSQNENEKKKKDIEEMRKRMPELKRLAFENFYWLLLKQWLIAIATVVISAVVGVFLGVVLSHFVQLPISPLSASDIHDLARTIIAPSITTYGFFITSVPVISFFYIQEIKEERKETMEFLEKKKKRFTEKEDLKIVNSVYGLYDTFWYNLRIGVLKYVRTYLAVGIITLFLVTYLYLMLSFAYEGLFIVIDICLLVIILSGIFPIIISALSRPPRILVRYVISQEFVEKIEYED